MIEPARAMGTGSGDDLPKTSAPATRALESIGISRLEQLTQHTEREIAALHGMGPKALGILRDALAARGLSFADDTSEPSRR